MEWTGSFTTLSSLFLDLQLKETRIQILRLKSYDLHLDLGKNQDTYISHCNCPLPNFV